VKDLCRQLPDLGRLAYPMRGEVTNRAVLGRKCHGRPEHPIYQMLSGGNDLGGSKLGGLKIIKWLQPRNTSRSEVVERIAVELPTQ